MKKTYLALACIAAAIFFLPTIASAVTLTEFDNESPTKEFQTYGDAVAKAITDADNKKNGALGDAIKAYFADKPANADLAPGIVDFMNEVNRYGIDAKAGKVNPDTTQIDEILKKVIDAKFASLSENAAINVPSLSSPAKPSN